MAITARAEGTWIATAASPQSVTIPGGSTTGDRMFLLAAWKDFAITATVDNGVDFWDEITEFADGSVPTGNGTGSMKVGAWYRDHDGSEANPNIEFTGAGLLAAVVIVTFQKGAGETWDTPAFATGAIAAASPFSVTASSDPGITAGDLVIELIGLRDDSSTLTRSATTALDATGITWSSDYVEYPAAHLSTTTGNDMSADAGYRIASSGTASAAPTGTGDPVAAETGAALFIRQRVSAVAAPRVPRFTSYPQLLAT